MKLLKVDTLAQARERLLEAAKECLPETERVALADASGCILAEDIVSGEMIPAFRRSSVDGYAVCSKDTAGATESIPVFLKVLEEVEIGHPAVSKIEPGTCAYVPTGGMVPEGADAMVMVEYSERFGTDEVALYENVPYGKCIVLPGEDVKTGDIVLKAGTRIGPAQAGTLAALGVVQVPVFKPWKVAILSTGDELVRIDQVPGPGQVRDINTWALSCYVKKTGLELVSAEAVRDEEVLLEDKIREAVKACDLILISGGSSQGKKDMTMEILNRISKEGVFTHGLALKPGREAYVVRRTSRASGSSACRFPLIICVALEAGNRSAGSTSVRSLYDNEPGGCTRKNNLPAGKASDGSAGAGGRTGIWKIRLDFDDGRGRRLRSD